MFSLRQRRMCVFAILLIVPTGGCDDTKEDTSAERIQAMAGGELKTVVPVSGKVMVDGKPTTGITLFLHPEIGVTRIGEVRTDAEGKYCWQTYAACDGILPGSYTVTFRLVTIERDNDNFEPTDDQFRGKFADPRKSKFKLNVEAGVPQTDVNYELSTK